MSFFGYVKLLCSERHSGIRFCTGLRERNLPGYGRAIALGLGGVPALGSGGCAHLNAMVAVAVLQLSMGSRSRIPAFPGKRIHVPQYVPLAAAARLRTHDTVFVRWGRVVLTAFTIEFLQGLTPPHISDCVTWCQPVRRDKPVSSCCLRFQAIPPRGTRE